MGFWQKLFGTNEKAEQQQQQQQPEDLYKAELTDTYVKITHPNRADERIEWAEIEEIKLINTDEGPFLPDVWLLLVGNGKGCSIPQGAPDWNKIYNIVSKYPGFNFENVIKSASCTDNQVFELWKK